MSGPSAVVLSGGAPLSAVPGPIRLVPSVCDRATGAVDSSAVVGDAAGALIILDDVGQSAASLRQAAAAGAPGAGNAVIRPYQCASPPRAVGAPTGPVRLVAEVGPLARPDTPSVCPDRLPLTIDR